MELTIQGEPKVEPKNIHKNMRWFDDMVSILKNKAGDAFVDDHFYRTLINNKLSQIATAMRCNFENHDGGIIPANFYSFLLATSGSGKGKANATIESLFMIDFLNSFHELFATQARVNIEYLAELKSSREGMEEAQASALINRRFQDLPKYLFAYNDSTEAGFKAIREKLTLASIGSTNIELDEIGINMHKVEEFLSSILEAYDTGRLKQKLIKMDSAEDTVAIPATFLSFGTGSTLLDGGEKEKKFMEMIRQGMGRRCCFSYSEEVSGIEDDDTEEFDPFAILSKSKCLDDDKLTAEISTKMMLLAKDHKLNNTLTAPTAIWAKVLIYQNDCKKEAARLSEFDDLVKLNLVHSYWSLSKLMFIYAFIDGAPEVSDLHFDRALSYIKESHKNFCELVKRKTNFERIANFICTAKKELTLFDINDALPFYKSGTKQTKQEMLDLAQAYAATHHMVIKHTMKDGIDYFSGSKLNETDTDKITLSQSTTSITEGFMPLEGKWEDLHMVPSSSTNYSAHRFIDQYRTGAKAIPGFNMIILDVDSGVDIKTAMAILDGSKYLITTTKSHQVLKHGVVADRYRIFLPMKFTLKMSETEFKLFMTNVMDEFPIPVDPACKDIARFYHGTTKAEHWYGEGDLFDPTDLIPDTEVNKKRITKNIDIGDIGSLERYFLKKTSEGNRNDNLLRFALTLVDTGIDQFEIEERLKTLNDRLGNPLPQRELSTTILRTVQKKIFDKEGQ